MSWLDILGLAIVGPGAIVVGSLSGCAPQQEGVSPSNGGRTQREEDSARPHYDGTRSSYEDEERSIRDLISPRKTATANPTEQERFLRRVRERPPPTPLVAEIERLDGVILFKVSVRCPCDYYEVWTPEGRKLGDIRSKDLHSFTLEELTNEVAKQLGVTPK